MAKIDVEHYWSASDTVDRSDFFESKSSLTVGIVRREDLILLACDDED